MKLAVRKTTTVIAALATAGVSSIFMGATPAFAAADACGAAGSLIAPGVCEQTFTTSAVSFTPTADMTQLEVLLVGAGGTGGYQEVNQGYSAAGGGGEVKIVDFHGATGPLAGTVPTAGTPGSVSDGTTTATVNNGEDAANNGQFGGNSGSGFLGGIGGGGGAAANSLADQDGGAGVIVSDIALPGSLFSTDANCYGGGGAGISSTHRGAPGCGGGGATNDTGSALFAPTANSGGGGGGLMVNEAFSERMGADGLVVIRWTAAPVTVTFDVLAHGSAPASQTIPNGTTAVQPSAPTATGYTFNGWFTDEALTTPANFADTLIVDRTYYASWNAVNYAVEFTMSGHGTAPANQTVPYGTAPVQPSAPTATGYTFNGWFTDSALTTPANFATPITGATMFYASWTAVPVAPTPTPTPTPTPASVTQALAATGSVPNATVLPIGLAMLLAGAAFFSVAFRRKRKNS